MAGETSDHFKLPEDSLIEILLRSSVKSLLHAKCVSKQWYSLIRDTNFVHKHLQYQKNNDKGHLLLQYFEENIQRYNYVLFTNETSLSNSYHNLDHFQLPYVRMEGPVNGLYCLFNGCDRIILWNPALMEVRIVPLPQTHLYPNKEHYRGAMGFGIDPFSHDYKLVLIRNSFDSNVTLYATMYNLTTNTWKLLNLGDFYLLVKSVRYSIGSAFLTGNYYWCTLEGEVISFDMREETFRQILGPDLALPKSTHFYYLTIYNEKVAFLHRYKFSIDIWLMVEEGIWIKQFSFTSFTSYFWIVCHWKNGDLLLAVDGVETTQVNPNFQLVVCDGSTQEIRNLGPKGNPIGFRASIYYESLVSVDGGTQHKGKCASLNTLSDFLH